MDLDLDLIQKESSNGTRMWACTWTREGHLVTGGVDGTVKIWYLTSESTFSGENNTLISLVREDPEDGNKGILSVALHPDGDILAASALDGSVRGYQFSTKTAFSILRRQPKSIDPYKIFPIRQLQFSPESEHDYLAGVGGSEGIKLWKDKALREKAYDINVPGTENKDYVVSIAWNSKGTEMACGSMSGAIHVLRPPDFQAIPIHDCPTMPVVSLAYSPLEEHILVSGSHDNAIRVHNTSSNATVSTMRGHSNWILTVEVSPDGDKVASGSGDRTLKLWDMNTAKVIRETTQGDYVWAVKFKAVNGESEGVLASVSDDGSISIYKYPRVSS